MKLLLVEDDHLQAEEFTETLLESFPGAVVNSIASEYEFYSLLDQIEEDPYDVIIMDVMLRWASTRPEIPEPPPEVISEKHYRAGFRCVKRLAERKKLKNTKVILFTVLQPTDISKDLPSLPPNVIHLVKDDDLKPFISAIRRLTANR